MKKRMIVFVLFTVLVVFALYKSINLLNNKAVHEVLKEEQSDALLFPSKRVQWEFERLKDPETNEIPRGIVSRELLYAQSLPNDASLSRSEQINFTLMGPWHIGGRTRAFAADVRNENILLAGGVSGGMWRSENGGQSWTKVTLPNDHHSVSCIIQDTRAGKEDVWYYGSGEGFGNSASKSFSATYLGNGMYKSTDNGKTWDVLSSTVSATPQLKDNWDIIWNVAVDPSNSAQDEVYAALESNIQKSTDGGQTWTSVLSANGSTFADVAVNTQGVCYATISAPGAQGGIFRSDNGDNWTKISGGVLSGNFNRIVIAIDPNDENRVYFLANTPGSGKQTFAFHNSSEWNSFFRYTYLSGDGSDTNGLWENLSQNLPDSLGNFGNFFVQSSYNMTLAVQPGNPNTVIIGGTNLYRSTDAFNSPDSIKWIGGYKPGSTLPFYHVYPNHHPDNHKVFFSKNNPSVLYSAHDGGLAKSLDISQDSVEWVNLNNGYISTQFYTVAINYNTQNVDIAGGTQDNHSLLNRSLDPLARWTEPEFGDGSFCAMDKDGEHFYFSRQNGRISKQKIDAQGNKIAFSRMDPAGGSFYLFINPFILDPNNNNIMYLLEGYNIWRNDKLNQIPLNNAWDTISFGWEEFSFSTTTGYMTAITASVNNPAHRLYVGASNRRIYKADNVHQGDPSFTDITANINSGNYTSCLAVDPNDADKLIAVYSNYNVISLWYTENGGTSWQNIEGNLEGNVDPTIPLPGYGDGPSCRWASILPTPDGNVYLVGTSVGLFATDKLEGTNTVWIQLGANSIGNVVVDMITSRPSDGFVAIATHGNGIYSTYITSAYDITKIKEKANVQANTALAIFPNPANTHVQLSIESKNKQQVDIYLFDQAGRQINTLYRGNLQAGNNSLQFDVSKHKAGLYYMVLQGTEIRKSQKFIIAR
jgi:hypothetical protein